MPCQIVRRANVRHRLPGQWSHRQTSRCRPLSPATPLLRASHLRHVPVNYHFRPMILAALACSTQVIPCSNDRLCMLSRTVRIRNISSTGQPNLRPVSEVCSSARNPSSFTAEPQASALFPTRVRPYSRRQKAISIVSSPGQRGHIENGTKLQLIPKSTRPRSGRECSIFLRRPSIVGKRASRTAVGTHDDSSGVPATC